jgi:hypothetical protein
MAGAASVLPLKFALRKPMQSMAKQPQSPEVYPAVA